MNYLYELNKKIDLINETCTCPRLDYPGYEDLLEERRHLQEMQMIQAPETEMSETNK